MIVSDSAKYSAEERMHGLKDLKLRGPGLQAVIFKLWQLRNHLEGLGRHRSLGPRPRDAISAMMLLAEEAHSEDQPCPSRAGEWRKALPEHMLS